MPPAPGDSYATYHVLYAYESATPGRRPSLQVFDDAGSATQDQYFGTYQDNEAVGELRVPAGALAFEIEEAAMARFGGHDGPHGRPVRAEYCEPGTWDMLVGQVAAVLQTWPRHAIPITVNAEAAFDAAVMAGRHLSADHLAGVKSGGVFSAGVALEKKLIDGVQSFDATFAGLQAAARK